MYIGASEGNRTPVISLGSFYSTIELHSRDVLGINQFGTKCKRILLTVLILQTLRIICLPAAALLYVPQRGKGEMIAIFKYIAAGSQINRFLFNAERAV